MGASEKHAATYHPGDGPTPRTAADVLSTGEIRRQYADSPGRFNELAREFDRWLAEHDREVAARALRDAADAYQVGGWADDLPKGANRPALILGMAQRATGWLRARADRIAAGEGS